MKYSDIAKLSDDETRRAIDSLNLARTYLVGQTAHMELTRVIGTLAQHRATLNRKRQFQDSDDVPFMGG